ncbi:MAG TPA: hypothetical protein ENH82_05505 [bacterium]|nr:hypothetical protein [bacterium]
MKVLLLGAGASKSYTESPTGQSMPVAKDFFRTFTKLKISNNPFVIIDAIVYYIEARKNISISKYFNGVNNIEEFHSEIEEEYLAKLKTGNFSDYSLSQKVNSELVYLFASVINEIQNGPISRSHCNLVKFLSSNDITLTFNWDTLMDRALEETTGWSTDNGYIVRPLKIYRDGWVLPNSDNINSPKLIKLHGSTNWISSLTIVKEGQLVLSQAASPETFYVFESTVEPFPAYEGRYMAGYEPFSYGYYPPNIPDPGKRADKGRVFISATRRPPSRPKVQGDESGLTSTPLIPLKNDFQIKIISKVLAVHIKPICWYAKFIFKLFYNVRWKWVYYCDCWQRTTFHERINE